MKRKCILLLALLIMSCGCATTDTLHNETLVKEDVVTVGDHEQQHQQLQEMPDGVIIALLDTGVSTTAIKSDNLLTGYNYVLNSFDTEDKVNHGTAVASVILGCETARVTGLATEAYVVPLVVVTKQEGKMVSSTSEVLAEAIRDSVDVYEADIINVSLGIQSDDAVLREAVEYASEKGALVVSAVGNSGVEGKPYYPASYEQVLAVGSCDKNGEESDFSQTGADVLAPGEDIWLASRNGVTYGARGTSYATGFVAATAANMLVEDESIRGQVLKEYIISSAEKTGGCIGK